MPSRRLRIALFLGGIAAIGAVVAWGQQPTLTAERLQSLLQRFPDADTNRDGTLTEAEALAHVARTRGAASKTASAASAANVAPSPTHANVSYGPHARNVLDFWRAKADAPTPLVVYIHGGGFVSGDKTGVRRDRIVQECLDAGVSFAAINYRFLTAGVPLQDILRDGARAVQFLRTQSAEWGVDKTRVAAYGGSAGAGISMWLAFHDDLADAKNPDPVLRESSRLTCVGAMQPQFSYDFLKWMEIFDDEATQRFGGQYRSPANYGFRTVEEMHSAEGRKIRADCDHIALMSADDPPLFISSNLPNLLLENSNQFLHHPKHGKLLYERAREIGLPVVANIPALEIRPAAGSPTNWRSFLLAHLQEKRGRQSDKR